MLIGFFLCISGKKKSLKKKNIAEKILQ